jgi:hypothetical protein
MCSNFAGIKRRAVAGAALNAFDYKLIRKRPFHGWQLEFPGAKIPALKRKARFCAEHHRTNGLVGLRPPSRRIGPAQLGGASDGCDRSLKASRRQRLVTEFVVLLNPKLGVAVPRPRRGVVALVPQSRHPKKNKKATTTTISENITANISLSRMAGR